jgi:hypothetical protein
MTRRRPMAPPRHRLPMGIAGNIATHKFRPRALPAGRHREDALREIEGFRVQIEALHRIDTRLVEVGFKVKE